MSHAETQMTPEDAVAEIAALDDETLWSMFWMGDTIRDVTYLDALFDAVEARGLYAKFAPSKPDG